jgi:hypothetical protein
MTICFLAYPRLSESNSLRIAIKSGKINFSKNCGREPQKYLFVSKWKCLAAQLCGERIG